MYDVLVIYLIHIIPLHSTLNMFSKFETLSSDNIENTYSLILNTYIMQIYNNIFAS